jgi:hypothetical protein
MAFKMKAGAEGPMKKNFPDLTGDGKVTQADILKGRGVFKSKADVINQYASGIGDALSGLAKDMPSKEERKEKKRQRMENREARRFKRRNK